MIFQWVGHTQTYLSTYSHARYYISQTIASPHNDADGTRNTKSPHGACVYPRAVALALARAASAAPPTAPRVSGAGCAPSTTHSYAGTQARARAHLRFSSASFLACWRFSMSSCT